MTKEKIEHTKLYIVNLYMAGFPELHVPAIKMMLGMKSFEVGGVPLEFDEKTCVAAFKELEEAGKVVVASNEGEFPSYAPVTPKEEVN